MAPIYNPLNTLAGWKDQAVGYTKDLFSDTTAGVVPEVVGPFPATDRALSPQHLEGLGLGAQQAVKDAMLGIGREERANAVLGIRPEPEVPMPVRTGGVREAQQVVKDALYNY